MKYKKLNLGLIAILTLIVVFTWDVMKSHFHPPRGKIMINPEVYSPFI